MYACKYGTCTIKSINQHQSFVATRYKIFFLLKCTKFNFSTPPLILATQLSILILFQTKLPLSPKKYLPRMPMQSRTNVLSLNSISNTASDKGNNFNCYCINDFQTKPQTVLCTACQFDCETASPIRSNFWFHILLPVVSVSRPPKMQHLLLHNASHSAAAASLCTNSTITNCVKLTLNYVNQAASNEIRFIVINSI